MKRYPSLRALLAVAMVATAVAGCGVDRTPYVNGRHMQPLSDEMLAEIENKNMAPQSAILMRIFKEESELEVWKEDKTGRFAPLRTYPICRWSGDLGPKIKAGDRQAPEGFYTITPGLMNPNSNYYLAINTGFPNAYDRANDRTGAFLMIHGDCASAGCYAMTDEQIAEIYAIARESFAGGQKSFQIQAFPFRMTPHNMARHRNSPHMVFWNMLKEGYDHFEVTHLPPKVDVCEARYVFDAEASGEFNPTDRCPTYKVPEDIADAVYEKQRRDEIHAADLINRGIPSAPITTRGQGGMHRTFMAAIAQSGRGVTIPTASGTIPSHVHPPAEIATENTMNFDITESQPTPETRASTQVVSAAPASMDEIGSKSRSGFGDDLKSGAGSRSHESTDAVAATSKSPVQTAKIGIMYPKPEPHPAETKSAGAVVSSRPLPAMLNSQANSRPPGSTNLLNGAQPTLLSDGFR